MNFRTTLLLLFAVAIVGAMAFWFTRHGERPDRPPAESPTLVAARESEITQVELTGEDPKAVVVLNRHGDGWRLSKPVSAPADATAVQGLISSLTSLRSQGQVTLAGNESATGLDRPSGVVVLTGRDGKSVRVAVGAKTGTGGNVYVRIDERESADLVPAVLIDDVGKPVSHFRNHQLLGIASADIRNLILNDADAQPIELEKQNADAWRIVRPFESPAEPAEASDIAFALSGLRAVEFVSETRGDLARYELDRPQFTVSVSAAATTTQPETTRPAATIIAFGGYDDVLKRNVYAMVGDEGPIVTVPAATLETFRKKPVDLRDRRAFDVDPSRVRRLTITPEPAPTTQPAGNPPTPVVIERATAPTTVPSTAPASQPAARWQLSGGAPADGVAVDSLLECFHPFRVNRYLSALNFVAVPSAVVISLETDDGQTHVLRLLEGGPGAATITGTYNELNFEAPGYVLERAKAPFAAPPDNR